MTLCTEASLTFSLPGAFVTWLMVSRIALFHAWSNFEPEVLKFLDVDVPTKHVLCITSLGFH